MKHIFTFVLIICIILTGPCFASASNTTSDEIKQQESEPTVLDRIDEKVKQRVKGSILGAPQKGNFALLEKAKLYLRGDFQLNGVYYNDRDLNGYNGEAEKWDPYEERYVRTQTHEKEGWMYHDLTLKPMIEFNEGLLTLHTEFYNGGYMWEMDVPNAVYQDNIDPPGYQGTIYDYTKMELRSAYLEIVTPLGFFIAGQLPDSFTSLKGVVWGVPAPKLENLILLFAYGIKNEGSNIFADEHHKGISYLDTRNGDGYQDNDDQVVYVFGLRLLGNENIDFNSFFIMAKGGNESPKTNDMDIKRLSFELDYKKDIFHLYSYLMFTEGTIAPLSNNEEGELIDELIMGINQVRSEIGDDYQAAHFQREDLKSPFGISFFGMLDVDLGNFKPEVGLMYLSGGKHWYEASNTMSRDFDPEGNRTPKKYLKSYLLNEVENKYFPLVTSFAGMQADEHGSNISYQNMTAIKIGTLYRINKHFQLFSQILGAWRSDVSYFEKDYWNTFALRIANQERITFNNPTGNQNRPAITLPLVLQQSNISYEEDSIDPFLGIEYSAKLTWLARKGLEISLIGSYFSMGGFYEDILTPKRYHAQYVSADLEAKDFGITENFIDYYGPYQAADKYERSDAWTIQLKFDFKFQ